MFDLHKFAAIYISHTHHRCFVYFTPPSPPLRIIPGGNHNLTSPSTNLRGGGGLTREPSLRLLPYNSHNNASKVLAKQTSGMMLHTVRCCFDDWVDFVGNLRLPDGAHGALLFR